MKKSDKLLILSCTSLLIYFVLGSFYTDLASPFVIAYNLLLDLSLILGYSGALILSFIGNATILFPFPYIGVPFIMGGLTDEVTSNFVFDPWLIGVVAGFGALVGEMTGYLIGYGGGKLIDQQQTNGFRNYIESHPRATPVVIWFIAATPIPDDVLIVPLGAARYPWWKVALPLYVGKTMFMMAIAWAGRFGLDFVEAIFGGTDQLSLASRGIEVIALFSVIMAIYLVVRMDWNRLMSTND
ncbi:MAG: VTT domain-containing protein [Candidatus Thorarchaeota archaeon]|jgi:membrane protein YqaA with SNARE-associated domain